jgi:hypothetical protein
MGTLMSADPAGSCSALIESLLDTSPTVIGRLVSVAALRDSQTGTYRHAVLAHVINQQAAHEVLLREHSKRFSQWLALTLSQQRGDLCRYFDAGDSAQRSCVRVWLNYDLPGLLIPNESLPPERSLFIHDFQWVLESIRHDVEPEELRFELAPPLPATATRDSIAPMKNARRSWLSGLFRSNTVQTNEKPSDACFSS